MEKKLAVISTGSAVAKDRGGMDKQLMLQRWKYAEQALLLMRNGKEEVLRMTPRIVA